MTTQETAAEGTPAGEIGGAADADTIDGPTKAPGVRARVRAELTAAIKASARRQLATDGAAALSLRAIARELDMASSAIYRYFASRDDLLTALIIDAYDAIGEAAERADAAQPRTEFRRRFVAIARAIRSWAHENPHEYALVFGSPVPGYAAPEDTIDPATRAPVALLGTLLDAHDARAEAPDRRGGTGRPDGGSPLEQALDQLLDFVDRRVPAETLALGVRAWAEIFGMVSLELFGHFNNAVTDPAVFFDDAVERLAERVLASREA